MTITESVIFSVVSCLLIYLGFGEFFNNKNNCELVRHNKNWRWLQPNNICTIRMVMAIVAYFFFFVFDLQCVGIFLFTLSAYLDGVDGLIARATGLVTELGEWYDPLCDKVTYIPPIFTFTQIGIIETSFYWIFLFLLSEIAGQFLVRRLQKIWGWSVAANIFGKVKAVLCFSLITYSALLMDNADYRNFAGELFCICAILSFVSATSKLMSKFIYVRFILLTNICLGVVGLFLVSCSNDYFTLILITVLTFLHVLVTVSPIFYFERVIKIRLKKIPKSIFVVLAALIFFFLAISLKMGDNFIIGVCMMITSSFFLVLGRFRVA